MSARVVAVAALWLVAARPLASQEADGPTYADAATAALVAKARARHVHQDSLVHDYQAVITTRNDVSAGRSRFARQYPLLAQQVTGRLTWRRPNDLKLEVMGARVASPIQNVQMDVGSDRPWFVPRGLGDSIRLSGIPETAALHPLAPGADQWYRYAIADSVIVELPGRTIRAIGVTVTPKRLAPSMVSGTMWVDAESADVVRLQVTFLGEFLWDAPDSASTPEDSAKSRRDNRRAQRILTVQADLEYSLHENRYWMPYRQTLALLAEIHFIISGAIPFRSITTFTDYAINQDAPIHFSVEVPDTAADRVIVTCADGEEDCGHRERHDEGYARAGRWENGRWEVSIPSADSLAAYQWREPLDLALSSAEEERIRRTIAELSTAAEQIPAQWVGRSTLGLALPELGNVTRFNRVQGFSLGMGLTLRPGLDFTTVDVVGRFGFGDKRPTGGLTWRRDAPAGEFQLRLSRSVAEAEPWTRGLSFGNTLNAAFAGHDDADYYLALGAGLSYHPYRGALEDIDLSLAVERQRPMLTVAGSSVNDFLGGTGVLPPNAPIAAGDFVRASVSPHRRLGPADVRLGIEGLVGDSLAGRGWVGVKLPFSLAGRLGALSLRSSYAVGDTLPQLFFRAGGPWTVRGYDYGTRAARGGWAAQLDVALTRRWVVSPVVFADAGDTFTGGPFEPLVGVGGGLSLLGGWMRLNGAFGVNPRTDFRFDLLFGAPR